MKFDLKAYLIVGRENTNGRPVEKIVEDAIRAGFTFIQIRSKVEDAKDLIEDCKAAADVIARLGKSDSVALVVNDRLDVVLAAREMGIKVDGIHVGQTDIPVSICRKYLGKDSIVGLSAPTKDLIEYAKKFDVKDIDYFGAGPVHDTESKKNLAKDDEGNVIIKTFEEFTELAKVSPVPVVIGGGVKTPDVPELKKCGLAGFFVISAVAGADDPYKAACEMTEAWNNTK